MIYNIHPIFVHFPIALLIIYSIIKILPFNSWLPNISWRQIQNLLLSLGVLGAIAADQTGEIAEHLVRPTRALVESHSTFASISIFIYALLLLGEFLYIVNPIINKKFHIVPVKRLLSIIEVTLTNKYLSKLLAFVGIIAISVTGLLGGVIVYGVTADPIAPFILNILGITI